MNVGRMAGAVFPLNRGERPRPAMTGSGQRVSECTHGAHDTDPASFTFDFCNGRRNPANNTPPPPPPPPLSLSLSPPPPAYCILPEAM